MIVLFTGRQIHVRPFTQKYQPGAGLRDGCCSTGGRQQGELLTRVLAVAVAAQPEGGAALVAGEAAPVEELALGANPLQHVDPLPTEVADLTAAGGRQGRDGGAHRLGGQGQVGGVGREVGR